MNTFDIIVIGAGSGGLNVAGFMNRIGLSVLLIEKSDQAIGGDCLNSGCVPSKALIHLSRLVRGGKVAEQFGVSQTGTIDIQAVMHYVRERQDVIRKHENVDYFREKGITVVLGTVQFVGKQEVSVDGKHYSGKKIVIATGSKPRTIPVVGSEQVALHTNETIFNIEMLPKDFVVLGGGPIGFEIGQAFSRLGSNVTIVNIDENWLAKEDRAVVLPLIQKMKEEGIQFIGGAKLSQITPDGHAVLKTDETEKLEIPCDTLFMGIGRIVNTEGLALECAGIETDERGRLKLDSFLRTTNPHVFAVGDVVGAHQFTHAAEVHASTVISNMFKPRPFWKSLNTDSMAWVTYTDPEIATFGLSEATLGEREVPYQIIEQPFSENDRSIVDARTEGTMRLFVSKRGKLLGGTLVGEGAGELVGELILAQTHNMKIATLFERVSPYPTISRINRLAAGQYMSGRLTEVAKRILRLLY